MKKLNINEIVKVKLTDRGKDIYYHQWDELIADGFRHFKQEYPVEDEDGFVEFQLRDFMRLYGKYLFNGCQIVTEEKWLRDCGVVV